jgi:hypothetical protein
MFSSLLLYVSKYMQQQHSILLLAFLPAVHAAAAEPAAKAKV